MNNSSVWNLFSPLRSGSIPILGSGQEMFGTVIRKGPNPKTIKVTVHYRFWNHMYRQYFSRCSKFLVHDEENFCQVGDKVVIKNSGGRISSQKHYYVRNVVKQFPLNDYFIHHPESSVETKNEYAQLYKNFLENEQKKKDELLNKEKNDKSLALDEAYQNLKFMERKEKEKEIKLKKEKREKEKRDLLKEKKKAQEKQKKGKEERENPEKKKKIKE